MWLGLGWVGPTSILAELHLKASLPIAGPVHRAQAT